MDLILFQTLNNDSALGLVAVLADFKHEIKILFSLVTMSCINYNTFLTTILLNTPMVNENYCLSVNPVNKQAWFKYNF